MSGTVNQLYGPTLLKAYCESSPLTRLKVSVLPSRQIITAVASEHIELGFGPFQQSMPDYFETLPLFTDERVLTISQTHTLATATPEQILKEVPLIVSDLDDQDMRPAIDKLRDAFGTISEVSDTELRLSLVSEGLGMSYIDRKLLEVDSRAQNMIVLTEHMHFARIPLTFGVFYRKGKPLSSGAEQFIECCKQHNF